MPPMNKLKHTQPVCLPHSHVLTCPFNLALCFTHCMCVYVFMCVRMCSIGCMCVFFCQTLVAQGTALPLNYPHPPFFLSHTHTDIYMRAAGRQAVSRSDTGPHYSMVSSYSSGICLVLADKLVAMMDAFSVGVESKLK